MVKRGANVMASMAVLAMALASAPISVAQETESPAPPAPAPSPPPPPKVLLPPPVTIAPAPSTRTRLPVEPADTVLRVTALDGGKAIAITGRIERGSFNKVRRVLDANKSATTLILASPGGLVLDGAAIGDLVRTRKLNTHVENVCSSACTAIFAGGVQRTLAPGGRLGFHESRVASRLSFLFPDLGPGAEFGDAIMRQAYRLAGADNGFVERALAVPSTTMWFPTQAELTTARIATRIAGGAELALPAPEATSRADVAGKLASRDFWKKAKVANPALYEQAIDAAWFAQVIRPAQKNQDNAGTAFLFGHFIENLNKQPDAQIGELSTLLAERFGNKDNRTVAFCTFGSSGYGSASDGLAFDPSKREEAALLAMMAATPVTTPLTEEKALQDAAEFVVAATSSGKLSTTDPTSMSFTSCDAAGRMFSALVDQAPDRRARAVRALAWISDMQKKRAQRLMSPAS